MAATSSRSSGGILSRLSGPSWDWGAADRQQQDGGDEQGKGMRKASSGKGGGKKMAGAERTGGGTGAKAANKKAASTKRGGRSGSKMGETVEEDNGDEGVEVGLFEDFLASLCAGIEQGVGVDGCVCRHRRICFFVTVMSIVSVSVCLPNA